jgi:hypothetical protein
VAIFKLLISLLRSKMKIKDQLSKEANKLITNCSKKVKMSNLLRTKITQGLIIINLNFLTILSLTRTIVEAMDLRLRTTINKDREINVFKESTNKSTQIDREIVK